MSLPADHRGHDLAIYLQTQANVSAVAFTLHERGLFQPDTRVAAFVPSSPATPSIRERARISSRQRCTRRTCWRGICRRFAACASAGCAAAAGGAHDKTTALMLANIHGSCCGWGGQPKPIGSGGGHHHDDAQRPPPTHALRPAQRDQPGHLSATNSDGLTNPQWQCLLIATMLEATTDDRVRQFFPLGVAAPRVLSAVQIRQFNELGFPLEVFDRRKWWRALL